MSVPTSDVDLLAPNAIADPHAIFAALRELGPIVWLTRHRAWMFTTHEAVRLGFHDQRLSSDRLTPLEARLDDSSRAAMGQTFDLLRGWMVFHDEPEHTRLREPLRRTFTPSRVTDLRPRIEEIVDELLDDLAGIDEPDLVRDFAFPLPAIVIAELLGVPAEDRDDFKHWSDQLAAIVFGSANRTAGIERAAAGSAKFVDYFTGLVDRNTSEPTDNLISALIAVTNDDPDAGLAPTELVGALTLLLFGGHETTTNLISNSMHSLLQHPAQQRRLRSQPDKLGGALEELHRFDGSTKLMVRVVGEDHERDGIAMEAGQTVFLGVLGANRDPVVFGDPNDLRLDRSNARSHLGYGYGGHFCLGAALARLETEVAVGRLIERFPHLALRDDAAVTWGEVLLGRGPTVLPISL
ncbi:MAG: cytochrome P450 [Ilumatobacter sp.]